METCASCGVEIAAGSEVLVASKAKNAGPVPFCETCAAQIEHVFQMETQEARVALALLVGGATGLAASLVWYGVVVATNYQLGILAVGVGWLVGQAVMWGAGGKRGGMLQAISVAITALAMLFSEYLIVRHYAVQGLAEEGITGIPWLLPPQLMVSLVVEGIKIDPVTLFFWAIALWQAFVLPRPRRLRRITQNT